MPEKNLRTASKLLNDFGSFINKRSLASLVIFDNNFSKILEWHFRIWKREYWLLEKEDRLNDWGSYNELSRIFDLILKNIEERSLQEGRSYSFFRFFEEHVEKYKKETEGEGDKKFFYIESLFEIFCPVFFENIETSPERFDVWNHYFPQTWKIAKNNLETEENVIARVFLHKFLKWARDRIWQSEEERFDQKLDGVTWNLFPETDPMLWAKILIFVLSPYGENRVKSVIEQPWNFGFIGRIKSHYESIRNGGEKIKIETERAGEVENTFELLYCLAQTYLIFSIFSRENLRVFIGELEKLERIYPRGSGEYTKRAQLANIFGEMLKFLEDKDR